MEKIEPLSLAPSLRYKMPFHRVTFVCSVLLFSASSAHCLTQLEERQAAREQMEAAREQMKDAIDKHQCPAILTYKTSPELKAVCPDGNSCQGLHDAALSKCSENFWSCHASYRKTIEADDLYNKFLNAECSEAAKNRKAIDEATAARLRAKQIDDSNARRDLR